LKKKPTVRSLKKKLDTIFAEHIRLRDGINGRGQCITCGEIFPLSELDAGHFRSRKFNSTRYDERNVQLQCHHCNRYNSGEPFQFGLALDKKYGEGTALELIQKSHQLKQWAIPELQDLIKYYKEAL